MVFQLQLLEMAYFIFNITGAAIFRPGGSVLVEKTPCWVCVNFVCESKKENINPIQNGRAAFWGPS